MARPRTSAHDLPKYMALRRGAYFFRDPVSKRWIRLGTDLDEAKLALRAAVPLDTTAFPFEGPSRIQAVQVAKIMLATAKSGASQRGIEWGLVLQDVLDLLATCNWQCAVTGLPFTDSERAGKRGIAPWMPSLDRIESRGGYVPGNVRLVCSAVNFALGDFGEEVLFRIASALVEKRRISSVSAPDPSHKVVSIHGLTGAAPSSPSASL